MYITTVFAFDVMLSPGLTAGSFVVTLLVMSSIDFVFYWERTWTQRTNWYVVILCVGADQQGARIALSSIQYRKQ